MLKLITNQFIHFIILSKGGLKPVIDKDDEDNQGEENQQDQYISLSSMGKSHLNVDDQEPVVTSSKKAKEPDSQSENRRQSTRSTTAHTSPPCTSDKGDGTDYNYNERLEIARKQQQMYWDAIKYENKFKEQMTDPAVVAEQEQILEDINKSKASHGRG